MTRGEKLCLMRELYEAGSSLEAIAEATGYKVNSVQQLLSQAGVKRVRRIADDGEKIIQMRREGKKLSEISKATGYNICSISNYLCKIGCNKNRTWKDEEYGAEPVDESRLIFAQVRKPEREIIIWHGRTFINVLDEIVPS